MVFHDFTIHYLVKDYGINQGKVRLINGQPPESTTGSPVNTQPTMLYAIPLEKILPIDESYELPSCIP